MRSFLAEGPTVFWRLTCRRDCVPLHFPMTSSCRCPSARILLALGADGAILVSADEVLRLPTPTVQAVSTVGAGDSFLAAFVLRIAQGRPSTEAFRSAIAAGSATAMTPATDLCRREDVERFERELLAAG